MAVNTKGLVGLAALGAMCVLGLSAGPPAMADSSAAAPAAPGPEVLMVDAANRSRELEVLSAIRLLLEAARDNKENLGLYSDMALREISFRESALGALENNLTVKRAGITKRIAEAALEAAAAAFDPLITVTGAYSHTRSEYREETVWRFKKGTNAANQIVFSEGPIQSLQYNAPRPPGFYLTSEVANEATMTGSTKVRTTAFSVTQLLPWGTRFNLDLEITHKPAYFILNNGAANLATYGTYDRPWVSTLTASFSTPLPLTKDFGPLNATNVTQELTRLGARSSMWNVRVIINSTLLSTDHAYWGLVSAAQSLKATLDTRTLVEDLEERTGRLFRARAVTSSRYDQVVGELERVRGEVETAFVAYVQASNALRKLLGEDDPQLLMPVGYLSLMDAPPLGAEDPGLTRSNPDYLKALVAVEAARLSRDALEARMRPDIYLTGSATLEQQNTVFGYRGIEQSLEQIPNPDKVTLTTGVSFQRALGNRAAEAALAGSQYSLAASELARRKTENQLEADYRSARIQLDSARQRLKITRRNLELADKVYRRALRFQKERRVTEYEIIDKARNLLSAREAHIDARISAKKAESTLLASTGQLAGRYPQRTAETDFDRRRLDILASRGVLGYFAGPPK